MLSDRKLFNRYPHLLDSATSQNGRMSRRRAHRFLHALTLLALSVLFGLPAGCSGERDPIALFNDGNYAAAFPIFEQRAAAGDIEATYYSGVHYYMGGGVERDFKRAAKLFEIAALADHPGAQRLLGVMYLRGYGVEHNYQEAYGWLFMAHEGGNEGAKEFLVMMSDNVTPNAAQVARKRIRAKIDEAVGAGGAIDKEDN